MDDLGTVAAEVLNTIGLDTQTLKYGIESTEQNEQDTVDTISRKEIQEEIQAFLNIPESNKRLEYEKVLIREDFYQQSFTTHTAYGELGIYTDSTRIDGAISELIDSLAAIDRRIQRKQARFQSVSKILGNRRLNTLRHRYRSKTPKFHEVDKEIYSLIQEKKKEAIFIEQTQHINRE